MAINWTYCNGGTGVVIIAPADIAAILEEMDAKPGLGVQDSAGLWDNELDYEYAIEDETDDLIEARLDNEFWARGC